MVVDGKFDLSRIPTVLQRVCYWSSGEEIGSDPAMSDSHVHTQVQLGNSKGYLGTCHIFDIARSSNLGLVPLGGSAGIRTLTI